jgi:very-short-patch-repair endonuclease
MRGGSSRNRIWTVVAKQHGVLTRRQLLELGLTPKMIDRRLASGRLHALWRGVYSVGRPRVTLRGWWRAAVLACGPDAVLSHISAAGLWGIRESSSGRERRAKIDNEGEQVRPALIDVSIPGNRIRRLSGIRPHRRSDHRDSDRTVHDGIPVTSPARTLIDLATLLQPDDLEMAVNEADKLGLVDPETLRRQIEDHRGMEGVKALRRLLDRRTFSLTDSELERRFLRVVRQAGFPRPKTQQRVNGLRVDFLWPELGLIVETDGLRYHRTPTQQAKDRVRDQALVAAGFIVLRFTHAQVTFEPDQVVETLRSVATLLSID